MNETNTVTVQGWVARDENLQLYFYPDKPERVRGYWMNNDANCLRLDPNGFPQLGWDDEPLKATLTITPTES